MNAMDTALYERGKQLLEAKLAEHSRAGRLQGIGSLEEANLAEILRRDTPTGKQRQRHNHTAHPASGRSDAPSKATPEDGE